MGVSNLPFAACVRAGDRAQTFIDDGNVWTLELPRGFLSIALEKDLRYDPAFLRHFPLIEETLARFKPDLVHITGPRRNWLSSSARDLPTKCTFRSAAKAGTPGGNIHEYAARRSDWFLRLLPARQSAATGQTIEDLSLAAAARFYSIARVLFAPNPELCQKLERMTGRPCHLMPRGVDAELFHPAKRKRQPGDHTQVLGFVGRLSVEKNIAGLVQAQSELEQMGRNSFRFTHQASRRA